MKGFSFDVNDPSYVCIWTSSQIDFDLFRICASTEYYSKCEGHCVTCTNSCDYCSAFGCHACQYYVAPTVSNTTNVNVTNNTTP